MTSKWNCKHIVYVLHVVFGNSLGYLKGPFLERLGLRRTDLPPRLVNLCGRGDKDMLHVAKARGVNIDTDVKLNKTDFAQQ